MITDEGKSTKEIKSRIGQAQNIFFKNKKYTGSKKI